MKVMMVARSVIVLALLLVSTGLPSVAVQASAAQASAAQAAATGAESPAGGPQVAGGRKGGLIDATSVFFGCAVGTTVGALVTALPPLVGWTFYAGALPAVVALIATSGIGCTVGLFGGVILSTLHWVVATVGEAWSTVFG